MTRWYVNELSKLTHVSVRTLHHYDGIGLLKPSIRLANGYRLYSEVDLLKLQQIIALKFFGFKLSQINFLINADVDVIDHFLAQTQFLQGKIDSLLAAKKALEEVLSNARKSKSIPWEMIVKVIEVYRMTQTLEHTWVKEIFTSEELTQYVAFETELKNNSNENQKAVFEKNWSDLVEEIKNNLEKDPKSEIGVILAEKCMRLINGLYGKKYAHLRTKKFEQGFGKGKGLDEVGLTPESVSWLEKAMDAYWRHRIYGILSQVEKISSSEVLSLWNEVLDEMYGEDSLRKKAVVDAALEDDKISVNAKKWLKNLFE